MNAMFYIATSFNGDISNRDGELYSYASVLASLAAVIVLYRPAYGAKYHQRAIIVCLSLLTCGISPLISVTLLTSVSKVTTMFGMFRRASSFNMDISY
jgi:hypothetical protein